MTTTLCTTTMGNSLDVQPSSDLSSYLSPEGLYLVTDVVLPQLGPQLGTGHPQLGSHGELGTVGGQLWAHREARTVHVISQVLIGRSTT